MVTCPNCGYWYGSGKCPRCGSHAPPGTPFQVRFDRWVKGQPFIVRAAAWAAVAGVVTLAFAAVAVYLVEMPIEPLEGEFEPPDSDFIRDNMPYGVLVFVLVFGGLVAADWWDHHR